MYYGRDGTRGEETGFVSRRVSCDEWDASGISTRLAGMESMGIVDFLRFRGWSRTDVHVGRCIALIDGSFVHRLLFCRVID